MAIYNAFRFLHPDLDATETDAGLGVTPTGALEMVSGHASVRQAVLLLLSTAPGERVMRPDYGCELGRLVFAPNDDTTAGLAIHYVRQAIKRFEPRIEILRLNASRDPAEPERLVLELSYQLRVTRATGTIFLPVDLSLGGV